MKSKQYLVGLGLALTVLFSVVSHAMQSTHAPGVIDRNGYIRIIHLSPDTPDLTFRLDGAHRLVERLGFTESSEYQAIQAGRYSFDLVTAEDGYGENDLIKISDWSLEAGDRMTLVVYGRMNELNIMLIDENLLFPSVRHDVAARVIHTAYDAGPVDIWRLPLGKGLPAMLVEDLGFGETRDGLWIPSDGIRIGIDADMDSVADFRYAIPGLREEGVVNVFAVQDTLGVVFILAQMPDGETVRIDPRNSGMFRFVNLSPGPFEFDVWFNERTSFERLIGFGETGDFRRLLSGLHAFDISTSGCAPDEALIRLKGVPIKDGRAYTLVTFDRLTKIKAIILEENPVAVKDGQIALRPVHLAAGAGKVDLLIEDRSGETLPLWKDLDFAASGDMNVLEQTGFVLGVDVNRDGKADIRFDVPEMVSGTVGNLFLVIDGDALRLRIQTRDGGMMVIDSVKS